MRRDIDPRRGGFTLIELLTTVVVIGILAGVAMPTFRGAVAKADARKVVTDMAAVRTAVLQYREEEGGLPPTTRWGQTPAELAPYLGGVDFQYKGLSYRLVSNERRGRVDFRVRYDRNDPIAEALRVFDRPGNDAGSATWNRGQMRFRLLENDQ